jgi:hypothetical protein
VRSLNGGVPGRSCWCVLFCGYQARGSPEAAIADSGRAAVLALESSLSFSRVTVPNARGAVGPGGAPVYVAVHVT